jgi:hypothetical protein
MNIEIDNVIIVFDAEKRMKRYYFIIENFETSSNYKVVEVFRNGDDYDLAGIPMYLDKNTCVSKKIILDSDKIKKILNLLCSENQLKTLLGQKICYNGRILEVVLDKGDRYLCVDRTSDSAANNIIVEFIPKNVKATIVGSMSQDKYHQTLNDLYLYLSGYREEKKENADLLARSLNPKFV